MPNSTLDAEPHYFGAVGRRLFGLLDVPPNRKVEKPAVLLCYPFGVEAIRAHRPFRVLSDWLSRAGHPVLRFDFYGTGDSDGNDTEVTIAGMTEDVLAAHQHLKSVAGEGDIVWIGLGLGATAAMQAAAKAEGPPSRLVLWDPIVNGSGYVDTLRERHEVARRKSLQLPSSAVRPAEGFMEALGFAIVPEFLSELHSLDLKIFSKLPSQTRITAVVKSNGVSAELLARRSALQSAQFEIMELEHDFEWIAIDFADGAVVPAQALRKLIAVLGDRP